MFAAIGAGRDTMKAANGASMKVARVQVRAGRAAEFNADGKGYSANGEGEYSRSRALGLEPIGRMPSAKTARRVSRGRELPLPLLIAETEQGVHWLECELRIEAGMMRRDKLTKNLEIKSRYLAELRGRLKGAQAAVARV